MAIELVDGARVIIMKYLARVVLCISHCVACDASREITTLNSIMQRHIGGQWPFLVVVAAAVDSQL